MSAPARITQAPPYSPETLAERWACSSEKVRLMCRDGSLASFRIGKLIRIPASEVERVECLNTESSNTEASTALPIPTPIEDGFASRLVRQTVVSRKLALVNTGECDTYDEGEGTCLCTRRCEWCNPLTAEELAERQKLRDVLAQTIRGDA